MIFQSLRIVPVLLLAASLVPCVASAASLGKPTGKVILTLSGNISHTNSGEKAEFDREMLEALGVTEVRQHTPWTDGEQTFSGVLGSKILDAVGAQGVTIVARAVNDYEVEIPASDLRDYPVLFAMKQGGRYMRLRDKGPLWIIYPYEKYPELATAETREKWIWQLSTIVVR